MVGRDLQALANMVKIMLWHRPSWLQLQVGTFIKDNSLDSDSVGEFWLPLKDIVGFADNSEAIINHLGEFELNPDDEEDKKALAFFVDLLVKAVNHKKKRP